MVTSIGRILVLPVLAVILVACSAGSDTETATDTPSSKAACVEPDNPYGDGGGHDAGFNWAEKTGGSCNGNSQSFNEGCAEYQRQLNAYQQCRTGK